MMTHLTPSEEDYLNSLDSPHFESFVTSKDLPIALILERKGLLWLIPTKEVKAEIHLGA